jgi:hypothetical protein
MLNKGAKISCSIEGASLLLHGEIMKRMRLKKQRSFAVLSGRKRLGTVTSKEEFDNLLAKVDRSKHKIKLKDVSE